MRRRVLLLLLCLSLLLVPAFVALSQDEPPAAKLDLTGVNANQLPTLILTTNVINRTGQPLLDLGKDNFILGGPLAERAEIVKVENITDDELAFAAVLVIDTSTSMDGRPLEQAKEAARLFVNALGPNDPIAIVTFDSTERVVQDYTTDKQVLLDTIDNLAYGGQTALYDGTVLGIETASRAPLPRRAVVLLSDGSEYGGISEHPREDGLQMALDRGVPVFAVGLGFGIDRHYLEEVATGSSAAFYESPSPEELPAIYSGLAQNFRSQYVVTIELNDFDLAAEAGDTTEFTVQATVPDGATNVVTSSLRVPISTPIVTLPEDLFANPLTETTVVEPTITADDPISSVVFTTSEGSETGPSYTIDPLTLAPGTYPLSITVTDATDDATTLTTEFTVASLPSEIEVGGLSDAAITEPTVITVTGKGQTPLQTVVYSFNGVDTEVTDAAGAFAFTLDPIETEAGEHTLTVTATNEGGSETTLTQTLTIGNVAPRINTLGVDEGEVVDTGTVFDADITLQAGVVNSTRIITLDGVALTDGYIDPAQLPPGPKEYILSVTDDHGLTAQASTTITIAVLPAAVSISAPELISAEPAAASIEVSAQPEVSIPSFTYSFDGGTAETGTLDADGKGTIAIPASSLGNGRHSLSVTVSVGENVNTTRDVEFTVALPTATPTNTPTDIPTATPTPSDTPTPTPTVNTTATIEAQATLTQQAVNITRTAAARSTRDADNTQAAETLVAVDTATSQAMATVGLAQTASARSTSEARRTEIAESNANAINTATADAQGTVDAVATFTALPGATQTAQIFQTATQLSNEGGTEVAAATQTQDALATATVDAAATRVMQGILTQTAAVENVTQTAVAQLTQQADATGQAVAQVSTSAAEATQNAGATQTTISETSAAKVFMTATALAQVQGTENAIASATNAQATQIIQDRLTATRAALDATMTQIANATNTEAAAQLTSRAALDATFTQVAGATNTQLAGLTATQRSDNQTATGQAEIVLATENAINALSTANAQSTADAQSTRQSATNSSDSTSIANVGQTQAALTVTQNARATLTAQPTLTPTIGPSATEPPPLVEIQSAPSPVQGLFDSLAGSPLVLVCVPLLCLLVIIVLFVLGGRRRRQP